mmetsp:Transcript_17466/g.54297  ORF Transcript_17466/g.54297 Transcript_17466/m.54297 type:complete len:220 (+) Transcript_17466:1086-1745(+)
MPPGHRPLARARDGAHLDRGRAAAGWQGQHGAHHRRCRAARDAPAHPHPHLRRARGGPRPQIRAAAHHHRHLPLPRHLVDPRQPALRPRVRASHVRARAMARLLLRAGRRPARDDALHDPAARDHGGPRRDLARLADRDCLPLPHRDLHPVPRVHCAAHVRRQGARGPRQVGRRATPCSGWEALPRPQCCCSQADISHTSPRPVATPMVYSPEGVLVRN